MYSKSNLKLSKVIRLFWLALPWILSITLALISAYLYLKKTASFRFFDEENNLVAGYLMTQGRELYRDIFMNHNPLPLVISQLLQSVFQSHTLFELVKLHRVYMVVFGLIANALLLVRFRSRALLFVGVYEYLRFYISGQMFLAEGMIAYMFAYYVFLISEKYFQKQGAIVSTSDLIISSVLFVFISLSREPYVPAAIFLYLLVILKASRPIIAVIFFGLSSALIAIFMMQYELPKFFEQVFLLNKQFSLDESSAQGGWQIFSGITHIWGYLYSAITLDKPLYIILGVANVILLFQIILIMKRPGKLTYKICVFVAAVTLLFLTGMRNFPSGIEWFGMYRSIPYIVVILAFVSFNSKFKLILFLLSIVFVVALTHPRSHFVEKRTNADEYYINYSTTTTDGAILELLCRDVAKCTLHIDDIYVYPYFVSEIKPSTEYAFYYPVQRAYLDYKNEREVDLSSNPPTLYYDGSCQVSRYGLPKNIESDYIWLIKDDGRKVEKSCIAFHKSIVNTITDTKKEMMRNHFYKLPNLSD